MARGVMSCAQRCELAIEEGVRGAHSGPQTAGGPRAWERPSWRVSVGLGLGYVGLRMAAQKGGFVGPAEGK